VIWFKWRRMCDVRGERESCYGRKLKTCTTPDNVVVVEFLQQTDLTNGRTGHSFILCLQSYFLESHDLVVRYVPGLVHNSIGSYKR